MVVKKLNRQQWMKNLAEGQLQLEILLPGYSTFDDWYGFQDRAIPYFVVYLLLDGSIHAQFHQTNQTLEIRPGSFLMVAPHVRHTFALHDPKMPITLYHLRLQAQLSDGQECTLSEDVIHIPSGHFLRPDIERLYAVIRSTHPYRSVQLRALFILLFAAVFEADTEANTTTHLTALQQAIINHTIQTNLHKRLTSSDLATAVGLSPDYFARLFRQSFGVSPRTYLVQERIQVASSTLLETHKTITQIAEDLGYTDIYLFSRQFKQVIGCSPSEFRQRHRG